MSLRVANVTDQAAGGGYGGGWHGGGGYAQVPQAPVRRHTARIPVHVLILLQPQHGSQASILATFRFTSH